MLRLCVLLWLVSVASAQLPPFPLEAVVSQAQAFAHGAPAVNATGLHREDFLHLISGIVEYFRPFQNTSGAIIDQYAHEEIQYSTPCYAFAAATLVANQYPSSAGLLDSAALAFDWAVTSLANANCAQGHCNFYIMPLMFALSILRSKVTTERLGFWENELRRINPYNSYHGFQPGNWGLVAASGEFLRDKAGLNTNTSWYQAELVKQWNENSFTANGQYQDFSGYDGKLNPMPYDHFPRKYIAVMLKEGYTGPHAADYLEYNRRAAWVSLLMQSPRGEMPTGGRSSQHQWNEAVSTVSYEMWAAHFQAQQQPQFACMFKRASRLSLQSLLRWQNPTGELQVVKNFFNPKLRWGYEEYTFQSQYNLLPASMLSTALHYMDESIQECPSPADVGGFAFYLPHFHKVFGHAGNVYVEIETGADPHYESTGLNRVHTAGLSSLIGPTAGAAQEHGGLAVGLVWHPEGGKQTSLADMSFLDIVNITFAVIDVPATPASSSFQVTYTLKTGDVVDEIYLLSNGQARVTASLTSKHTLSAFGAQFAAFVFDGLHNTTISLTSDTAVVSFSNSRYGERFSVNSQTHCAVEPASVVVRNGIARSVVCPVEPSSGVSRHSISYALEAVTTNLSSTNMR